MRILMLVIRFDRTDWATAFIPNWVTHLAKEVDALDVLALEVGEIGELPLNVRVFSMGKERGLSRGQVLLNFYSQAIRLVPQCDAVFVHMIPRYVLLVAPLALPMRKPITLWYTHRNLSRDLKLALPLVKRVVTAVGSSFPSKTSKLRVLGHGIDTSLFTPGEHIQAGCDIVQVARLQPIKNQIALIEALQYLPEARAVLIGEVPNGEDRSYLERMQQRVTALGLAERVIFAGGLSLEAVMEWYRRAAVAVNLSPPGLFDKAALESMACGVPTLVSNSAFDDLLGDYRSLLRINYPPEPEQIAAHIQQIANLSDDERAKMAHTLSMNVRQAHSLETLIPRLASVLKHSEII